MMGGTKECSAIRRKNSRIVGTGIWVSQGAVFLWFADIYFLGDLDDAAGGGPGLVNLHGKTEEGGRGTAGAADVGIGYLPIGNQGNLIGS